MDGCHTSSYGPEGPRAHWPGFDQLFQAYSGWEVEGGGEGNPPMWHRMGMMDHQNGLASLLATLLALLQRERTGQGQFVSASILGASALTASETLVLPDGTLAPVTPLDQAQTGVGPGYRIYAVEDGWVAVAALQAQQLEALRRVAGVLRDADLAPALRHYSAQQLVAELEMAEVPVERVRLDQGSRYFDALENRRSRLAVRYPHVSWGQLEQIGALWSFGDLPLRLERAPPGLGQHTREILQELGFNAAERERLAQAAVIAGPDLAQD